MFVKTYVAYISRSLCGWTQEISPQVDQLDWKRHRGPGGTGYYKVAGDHTPGKDACKNWFHLFLMHMHGLMFET